MGVGGGDEGGRGRNERVLVRVGGQVVRGWRLSDATSQHRTASYCMQHTAPHSIHAQHPAPHRTDRTAPHRTAPRRTAPHRTAPHTHHVNAMVGMLAHDFEGQLLAHTKAALVHRHAIHDRVGPGEVHVLEHARVEPGARVANLEEKSRQEWSLGLEFGRRVPGVGCWVSGVGFECRVRPRVSGSGSRPPTNQPTEPNRTEPGPGKTKLDQPACVCGRWSERG